MSNQAAGYYPPPESKGGWRSLTEPEQAQATATIDLDRLAPARAWNTKFSVPSSIVIIRSGYPVAEWRARTGCPPAMQWTWIAWPIVISPQGTR
jgi:hypothetical protein